MGLMHLVWAVIVGFIAGLLARALMPGPDPMGFLGTVALGIVGSVVGGFLGGLIWRPREEAPFHPAGFVMSVVGAIVVLFVWQRVR